ncbi:MAG TPA: hypothetical protein EYH32_10625 [Anaerolineae bacterium]|nr:hypothetical protein [Anaerolineae bacterium]
MRHAVKIFGISIRDWWDEVFVLAGAGLVAFFLVLTVIGAPPALAGLSSLAHSLIREKRIEFGDFWVGIRRYAWASWKLLGLGLLGTVVLAVDIAFCLSPQRSGLLLRLMGWIDVYALVIWLGGQIYVLPLLMRMEDRRTFLVLRNALLLCLGYPFFTFTLLALLALALAISIAIPILLPLVYLPVGALVSYHALSAALEDVERKRQKAA